MPELEPELELEVELVLAAAPPEEVWLDGLAELDDVAEELEPPPQAATPSAISTAAVAIGGLIDVMLFTLMVSSSFVGCEASLFGRR
jgi:hypothetical protein